MTYFSQGSSSLRVDAYMYIYIVDLSNLDMCSARIGVYVFVR